MPGVLEQVCSFEGPSWPHPDPCSNMSQRTDRSCNPYLSIMCGGTAQTQRQPMPPQDALQAAAPWPSPTVHSQDQAHQHGRQSLTQGGQPTTAQQRLGKLSQLLDSQQHFLQHGANGAKFVRGWGCRELNFHWVGMYRCEISLMPFLLFSKHPETRLQIWI